MLVHSQNSSLSSLHSWVGIFAIVMFCSNMLFGTLMELWILTDPTSITRKRFSLAIFHTIVGLTTLFLSTIAILTGITQQLGQTSCYYKQLNFSNSTSQHHDDIPEGCQVANVMGLSIVITTMALFLAVAARKIYTILGSSDNRINITDVRNPMNPL